MRKQIHESRNFLFNPSKLEPKSAAAAGFLRAEGFSGISFTIFFLAIPIRANISGFAILPASDFYRRGSMDWKP